MQAFNIYIPTRIVFGEGRLKEAGELIAPLALSVAIVTGRGSMRSAGFLDELVESLEAAGVEVPMMIEGTPPNPTVEFIDDSVRRLKEYVPGGVDMVIGLGGGSALDTAKALAFSLVNDGPVWEYITPSEEKRQPQRVPLPVVEIPSTSGTGSETSPNAVITNASESAKCPLSGPYLFPRIAIVDPRLPATMPKKLTVATAIDTWSHVFENFTQGMNDPFRDMLDVEAMRIVGRWLPVVVENPDDMEARSQLAIASFLGGMVLGISGAHVGHALEHPISAVTNCSHGEGLAFVLRGVTSFIEKVLPGRAEVAAATLPGEGGLGARYRAFAKLVGADFSPADIGLSENDFERIASLAMSTMAGACRRAPSTVDEQTLTDILKMSLE
jgi:alcohol dehydrogenase class IV